MFEDGYSCEEKSMTEVRHGCGESVEKAELQPTCWHLILDWAGSTPPLSSLG